MSKTPTTSIFSLNSDIINGIQARLNGELSLTDLESIFRTAEEPLGLRTLSFDRTVDLFPYAQDDGLWDRVEEFLRLSKLMISPYEDFCFLVEDQDCLYGSERAWAYTVAELCGQLQFLDKSDWDYMDFYSPGSYVFEDYKQFRPVFTEFIHWRTDNFLKDVGKG